MGECPGMLRILSISADIETVGEILLKIIPTLEEVRLGGAPIWGGLQMVAAWFGVRVQCMGLILLLVPTVPAL